MGGVHFIIFLGLWTNVSKRAQGKNMLTNMNLQYQLSHSEQRTMLTTLDSSGGMLMARSEICSTHVSRVMRIQSTGGSQFRGTLYSEAQFSYTTKSDRLPLLECCWYHHQRRAPRRVGRGGHERLATLESSSNLQGISPLLQTASHSASSPSAPRQLCCATSEELSMAKGLFLLSSSLLA